MVSATWKRRLAGGATEAQKLLLHLRKRGGQSSDLLLDISRHTITAPVRAFKSLRKEKEAA
jgi:hypothetical protein